MPTLPVPEGRRSKRAASKTRASLVINHRGRLERLPCLVIDSSLRGFRLRGSLQLRRGQPVEIILDDDPLNAVRCRVIWVGKAGSKQEGDVGLQAV